MSEKAYTGAIKKVLKILQLSTVYAGHIGRGIAPGCLEVEEISAIDKCAIGNSVTDVFGTHYDTKLPLTAMRAMSGHDSRRGKFIHPRSTFYGDESHKHPPELLFPWVDAAICQTNETKHDTALGFLTLIKNLRWVILQDVAVMIAKGKRDHYVFKQSKHVFDSPAFHDFSMKMMQHLNLKETRDPNKVGALTETVLPYVNGNLQMVNMSVNKMDGAVKQLSQDIIGVTQDINKDFVDIKEEINETVKDNFGSLKVALTEEIGKSSMTIKDNMTIQFANWNYNMSDSLVKQSDQML